MSTGDTKMTKVETPPESTLPDISDIAHRFDATPTRLAQVPRLATRSLAGERHCVRGEITEFRDDRFGNQYLDLCVVSANGIATLPLRLTQKNKFQIARFLRTKGQTVSQFFRTGSYVTVTGPLAVSNHGAIYLDIVKVDPYQVHPGPVLRRQRNQTDFLLSLGVDPARVASAFRHLSPDAHTDVLKEARDIAILTSDKSEALYDFKHSVEKNVRYNDIELTHVPVQLEGVDAVDSIIRALDSLNTDEVDLAVLVRGGGSWQSLTVFDDLRLAEAIFQSSVPVITGIGHTTDVSAADRVAAASFTTPSSAGAAIRKTVLRLNAQRKREGFRASKNQSVPAVDGAADPFGSFSRSRVEQLTRERKTARDEARNAAAAYASVRARYHNLLYTSGVKRVQTTARMWTTLWGLAALTAIAVGDYIDGGSTPAILVAGMCAYIGLYVRWGKYRALRPPRRDHEFSSLDDWEARAAKVRAPREFRRLWAGHAVPHEVGRTQPPPAY